MPHSKFSSKITNNNNSKRNNGSYILPHCKKPRNSSSSSSEFALVDLKHLDVPLITATTGSPCDSIVLHPHHPYTIGRSARHSQFLFHDRRVSKRHSQLLFHEPLRKLYILDGAAFTTGRFVVHDNPPEPSFIPSRNGVFVNGVRVRVKELFPGDEVIFVCANSELGFCGSRIGFVVQAIVFKELERLRFVGNNKRIFASRRNENDSHSKCDELVGRANTLLNRCRDILRSDDPISYIRQCDISMDMDGMVNSNRIHLENAIESNNNTKILSLNSVSKENSPSIDQILSENAIENNKFRKILLLNSVSEENSPCIDWIRLENPIENDNNTLNSVSKENSPCIDRICSENAIEKNSSTEILSLNSVSMGNSPCIDGVVRNTTPPPGKNFYLNRLMNQSSFGDHTVVSLPELLYPVESISQIFIATFTSDVLWFLSYCEIPCHLPVTLACHNTERCWSSGSDERSFVPYPDFPNLVVVYPPFPEAIAFGNDRKKKGIACHHPKLIVLQREDSMRVIITSANLVAKQWNNVTNTIWWQDFPRTNTSDYASLFTQIHDRDISKDSKSDFAAQLAGFMASLLIDSPSQAHWIVELTKYNFEGATGHLIASVPGIHSFRAPSMTDSMQLSVNQCAQWSVGVKFLGSVEASVVGLSHLFHNAADSTGAQLKKLAAFLGQSCKRANEMTEIVLRRNKNVPADANAVSVLVPNPNELSEGDCVQLGFLPRNVAKWVSPLWDSGLFRFFGYVYPKEALAAALGGNNMKVQLILHVSQGPHFQDISKIIQPEHVVALCSFIASIQRCTGLWRLQEVLGQYKWPESLESDFVYGASSIGTSINSQFLAAFSAASGKRSLQSFESDESDPEWGYWNASQELKSPSIKIIFPTIERVKNAHSGIWPSKRILCFSEKTWQRLRTVDILHDAVPHPYDRVGHPMHVKVARRRFQPKKDTSSFGWVYCGSHNFSAAAWGRQISRPSGIKANGFEKGNSSLGLRLHVCNYELGIIFTFPPTETKGSTDKNISNLDDIVLPFVVPAPKYRPRDRPATMQAMREALNELTEQERRKLVEVAAIEEIVEEIPDEEEEEEEEEEEAIEAPSYVAEEKEEEKAYAEILWSQVDSSQSC